MTTLLAHALPVTVSLVLGGAVTYTVMGLLSEDYMRTARAGGAYARLHRAHAG